MSNIQVITNDIYGTREMFASVVSDKDINFEREAGFAIQALSKTDYSLQIAINARQSVIDAVTNIAAIGISLNPAKKQAYLVPRDGKICLDISYMGLMDLAMATGAIKWAQAALVYATDAFALNGFDKPPQHTFNPFASDRGAIVGVYVVVKTADGEYLTHTMTYEQCIGIRDRSQAWKSFKAGKAKTPGPWGTDEGEMIKKTCVKQAYKYWPKTDRLEQAIHHLNTEGGEGVVTLESRPVKAIEAPRSISPERFEKALEAIAAGTYTAEKLRQGFALTTEQTAKLDESLIVMAGGGAQEPAHA